MDLHRIDRATPPSDETGEAEYWLGAVREYEDMWGFEVLNFAQQPVQRFLYPDRSAAETARAAMFKVLEQAVAVCAVDAES